MDQLYQGDYKLAGEIRQRTAKHGATSEDRARLRMKLEKPEEATEPTEKELSNFDMDEELYNKLRSV
ncbi:hypothetical protein OG306_33220 [Streptomyces sp. NBC_01241]|uniref:phage terminase small subunit n=1 Tax=Streptomyces sp. NBC_01241 TaxID=2903794 RepID=UPI00352DCB83|nr:hypothetical protein OG306_33220 [Streptomyces sp. NBC_01241]